MNIELIQSMLLAAKQLYRCQENTIAENTVEVLWKEYVANTPNGGSLEAFMTIVNDICKDDHKEFFIEFHIFVLEIIKRG